MGRRWWAEAPGTLATVLLLCAVFAIEAAGGAAGDPRALVRLGAFPNDALIDRQWWRVFTYAFLHLTVWHLVATVAVLLWAGRAVEARLGTARWAAIYAAGVVVPGAMLLLVRTVSPREGATMGATGALCALVAAAVVLGRRRRRDRPLRGPAWLGLVAAVALSAVPGASVMGHASGLLVGALLAFIFAGL